MLVEKLENRRLRIAPRMIGTGAAEEAVGTPQMAEDWGAVLLDEVMHESLCKQAVFLREGRLAEKFHVGRSIIRQIFSEFVGAGLLDHVARKGWLVHPVREQDVEAYLDVREVMELKALDLARSRINKEEVKAILEREMHGLNNAVHRYIIETSDNRYIRDFFDRYVARYFTKLFYYAAPETEVVDEMTEQHKAILEALLRDDQSNAAGILSTHIRAQKTVLEKLVDRGAPSREAMAVPIR